MLAQHAAKDKHCCADDVSSKKEFHYLLFLGGGGRVNYFVTLYD